MGNFGHMDLTIDNQSLCFRLVEHLLLYQKQCNLVPRASRLPSLFLAIILY